MLMVFILKRSNFSSKAVGKTVAEAEAKKTLFASVVPRQLRNNDKSTKTHYRLVLINGVYATRHVTHSIIH